MRIFFDTLLFISAVILPLPVTIILLFAGMLFYPRFYEAVAAAALVEFLYHGSGRDMWGSHLPLAALVLLILFTIEVLRSFIRERTL
ncbi:MAG: hypothetical protein A3C13_04480 [Candidatus Lloydbacteria bacterium RIFCSPHIGHO2_02_FULL_50_11]|nr:MAG: hypothetical protein A3C13_04480 [Candidatus Lloydbacteria bacterium RIFCSPHIGHO2_02_FULL_50_11]